MDELVATQSQFSDVASPVLGSNTRLDRWIDNWTFAATNQSIFFLVVLVAAAAMAAMFIVVWLDIPQDSLPTYLFWIGLPIALILFTIKIAFDGWRRRRHPQRRIAAR